jgi:cyclopropane fatty-acyl-phospholipid synthase-like methyltransferase
MNADLETMERIVPDLISAQDSAGQLSLQLHIERYQFACRHLLPGKVLDIACGTGYGTRRLADWSDDVCTGVDISEEAIAYAEKRYAHEKTRFICESIMNFASQHKFNNIISLETIEHIENPAKVVAHLKSMLLPGGRLIVSAPVTPSVDANPYHVNDFTKKSFRKLFSDVGFIEVSSLMQKQPYSLKEVSGKKDKTRKGLMKYYLSNPGKFFLRMRSLVIDGFSNKYLILILRSPPSDVLV